MSLERSNMPLSAKQISVMDKNNKLDYNHIVQRGLVWEKSRKSGLIESMILGYPVSQIYCRRDRDLTQPKKKGSSSYVIMDGKQRLTTISSYINNEWALTTLKPVTYMTMDMEEEVADISGMTFEELPEEIQDKIKDTSINFMCFDDITPEEERELFKRLNAGKPLSTKAKVLANCRDLENILTMGTHSIFPKMMTENALSQKNQVTVIMKIWAMLNKDIDDVSFEGKFFNPMVEETVLTEEEKCQIIDTLDYMEEVYDYILEDDTDKANKKIAKKFFTETHLVSFAPFVEYARENGTDASIFGDFVKDFFTNLSEAEMTKYNDATLRGSARTENIKIRNEVISAVYDEFFKEA